MSAACSPGGVGRAACRLSRTSNGSTKGGAGNGGRARAPAFGHRKLTPRPPATPLQRQPRVTAGTHTGRDSTGRCPGADFVLPDQSGQPRGCPVVFVPTMFGCVRDAWDQEVTVVL